MLEWRQIQKTVAKLMLKCAMCYVCTVPFLYVPQFITFDFESFPKWSSEEKTQ